MKKIIIVAGLSYIAPSLCMVISVPPGLSADDEMATELINRFGSYQDEDDGLSQEDQDINTILFAYSGFGSALTSMNSVYQGLSLGSLQTIRTQYQAQKQTIETLIVQNRVPLNDLNVPKAYQRFLMIGAILANAIFVHS